MAAPGRNPRVPATQPWDTDQRPYVLFSFYDPDVIGDLDVGLDRFQSDGDLDTTFGNARVVEAAGKGEDSGEEDPAEDEDVGHSGSARSGRASAGSILRTSQKWVTVY